MRRTSERSDVGLALGESLGGSLGEALDPNARRDPESFLRLIRRSRRGRLKVYLGYAPGVGKTYQMLLEGHRLHDQGVDVVIGYVEKHARPDTESLCIGLEEVPRRGIEYRGIRLEEMDLDALLARAPQVALIDELAHTNAPGGRHAKRWQDVLEVLEAGISVITTVNAQHLESLYDTIGSLVGVVVKERVPDWVVAEADQVVNVDLTIEDLRQRLLEGKVYPSERVPGALGSFFQERNLAQLRELTLREAAAQAQRPGGSRHEGPALFAPDQVMVCLSSRGPDAPALLRYASRLAGRLDRTWFAVYVQTPDEEPERLDATTQRRIAEALELAQQLGATVFTIRGSDVVGSVLRFAKEYGVGHLVVGRPGPPHRLRDRLLRRRSPVFELLERADGLTLVVHPEPAPPSAQGSVATEPTVEPPQDDRKVADLVRVDAAGLLEPRAVMVLGGRSDKQELMRLLVERLVELHPDLDGAAILRRLLRREEEASTFLDSGVGFPHARIRGLAAPLAAMAVCPEATGEDARRVTLLLLLLEERPDQALQLLAAAARVFRSPKSIDTLAHAASAEQVVSAWRALLATSAGATGGVSRSPSRQEGST